jgi:hypothetical protein
MGVSAVFRAGPYSFAGKTWGSPFHRCDFTVFVAAGRAVLEGADIYEAHNVRGWHYVQPPLFAIAMVPFAAMPLFWAVLTWYVLNVAMILSAVRMCVRTVTWAGASGGNEFVLYVLPPFLVLWLMLSALAHGQNSLLMLWLVVAALYCEASGRVLTGGACLAGATLVKIFPGLLLAYFLWRKKWRFAASSLLALALGLFVVPAIVYGWSGNLAHLEKWVSRVAAPSLESEQERVDAPLYNTLLSADMVNNQSLPAVLWRLTSSSKARWMAMLILAMMASVIVWVGRKARRTDEPLLLGATIVCALLVPPVSWAHYFMVLLFPLTALISVMRQSTDHALRNLLFVCLGIYAVLCALGSPRSLRGYGTLCAGAIVLWMALVVTAARRAR